MDVATDEAALVRRIGRGPDPEAEDEFCRRMAPRIRLYGLRHLRSGSAADDLVQQVLVTVVEALRAGRLREPERAASFVLGTCRMTVLDQRRTEQRRAGLLEQFGDVLAAWTRPPEPDVVPARLSGCLQALKERERTVIVLTFYDERTGADVARLLNVSEGNVRVIRHRALQRLRACLEVVP